MREETKYHRVEFSLISNQQRYLVRVDYVLRKLLEVDEATATSFF